MASKSLTESRKSLRFNSVYYEDLDNYDDNDDADYDDDKYRKIGSIRRLFKGFDSDYYKPVLTDVGFAERDDNYIEYTIKGDRYENLSPKKYFHVIRPYLRDLINEHKPTVELNDSDNDNNNNNNNNGAEWKFQMTMKTNRISTLYFEDKRTIFSKSKPVELLWAVIQKCN